MTGKSKGVWACLVICLFLSGCQASGPKPLYDRLGGDMMMSAIVDDFVDRASGDPRVNFTRKGTTHEWIPTPDSVDVLKTHLVEYFTMLSGGSHDYEGKDMRTAHVGMEISNAEFDAIKDDLRRSLEKYDEPPAETDELLTLVESTRKDIVEVK